LAAAFDLLDLEGVGVDVWAGRWLGYADALNALSAAGTDIATEEPVGC